MNLDPATFQGTRYGPALILLLKRADSNNFTAAFFLIASAGMALHYEAAIERAPLI